MRRTIELAVLSLLLLSPACTPATRGCGGSVVTTVTKFSGGPAPYRIATAHLYGNGCVRYLAGRARKCVCDPAVPAAFAQADAVVAAMEIAPRTLHDHESVSVRHGELVAERANGDLPPPARAWLADLDAALRPLMGAGYQAFAEGKP